MTIFVYRLPTGKTPNTKNLFVVDPATNELLFGQNILMTTNSGAAAAKCKYSDASSNIIH